MPDDLQKQVEQGEQAERLMTNETFQRACRRVEEKFTKEWSESLPDQVARREQAYSGLRALREITRQIQIESDNGKCAKAAQARFEKKGK